MVTAIRQFDKLQIGIESVKGTLVAATDQLVANWNPQEIINREYSTYPRGKRATVGGDGLIVQRHTELDLDMDLTPQEVIYLLSCGVRGSVSPSGGGDPYTWVFTPQLSTAVVTVDSMTVEMVVGDGTTNHYAREFGYALVQELGFRWAFNQKAQMTAKLFGRTVQTTTPTGSLTPIANREELASALLAVYIDDAWASLGGTQFTGIVRSVNLDLDTGLRPDFTLDNRSDRDMTKHLAGGTSGSIQMVLELDATGALEIADWRAGTRRYIRLKQNTGGGSHYIQFDLSVRITDVSHSDDNGQRLVTIDGELVYDETGEGIYEITVLNALSGL